MMLIITKIGKVLLWGNKLNPKSYSLKQQKCVTHEDLTANQVTLSDDCPPCNGLGEPSCLNLVYLLSLHKDGRGPISATLLLPLTYQWPGQESWSYLTAR